MRQISLSALQRGLLIAGIMSALPASAATLAVGSGKTYASPCKAFAAAKDGDTVEIQAQTYSGDVCGIYASNLTIRGVNGRPKIDAAGANAMGKGTWVVQGNNVVVENVEMLGARVADKNGAALRLEGTNFTLRSSFLHDNENGILSNAVSTSNIVIETSEFGHNGAGDGYSHNLYIGNVGSLTFRYNYSHDANVGHNLKSRARVNTIVYNRFSSLPAGQAGSGKPSYEIDVPNAGTTYIIGNVIQQPAANSNPNLIAYGEEGASNPAQDLYVVNNTFLNDYASGGTFIVVGSGVTKPVLVQNNIFAGIGTMSTQASAIDKTNFRSAAPGFVNRAAFDLHPTANAQVINAGSAPGTAPTGVSLAPAAQYKHPAAGETRPVSGLLDIGAYEAAGTTTAPAPTPAPTPTPTPTPNPTPVPGTWTTCASEGGSCAVNGTAQVRYGTATAYVTKTVTGTIACSNASFGDPAPGYGKTCSIGSATTPTPAPTPMPTPAPAPSTETWTTCANEGGTCTVSGTREVRYGYAGKFASKIVSGAVACSNAVFGDPYPNYGKSCSYSSVAR